MNLEIQRIDVAAWCSPVMTSFASELRLLWQAVDYRTISIMRLRR
jgi:hypothetical protein